MKFFISDLHLGHHNIIEYCKRPFASTAEMDAYMAQRWDAVVQPSDEVFVLGDISFQLSYAVKWIKDRPGTKHLAIGNHDMRACGGRRSRFADAFAKVDQILETKVDAHRLVLCHYPMLSWPGSGRGSIMLHGHCHGELTYPYPMRILDVGVDAIHPGFERFSPMSADVAIKLALDNGILYGSSQIRP